jgi:hypothetical protein
MSVRNGSINDNDYFIRLPDQSFITGSIIDHVNTLDKPFHNIHL